MAIVWGTTVGPTGKTVKVGIDQTYTVAGATATVTTNFYWWSEDPVTDTSNSATISGNGTVAYSGSLNLTTTASGTTKLVYGPKTVTINLAYGSTTTASSSYSQSGVDYIGTAIVASASVSTALPARPYSVPTAPSALNPNRTSDTSHTLNWTNNSTAAGLYQQQYVDRTTYDGAWSGWVQVSGTLAGTATSYTDTTTVANRLYAYRVRAVNTSGTGTSAQTATFATTPAAPTGLTATRNGAAIDLGWTNPAISEGGMQVLDSVDGGAASAISEPAADSTAYSHATASTASSHVYTVRAWGLSADGARLYSSGAVSALIPGTPIAPSGVTVARTSDTSHTVTWTNNTNTHDAYGSQYLERTSNGGASWSVVGAALAAGATSATDTTTAANNRYAYRVRAVNVTGSATSTPSDYFSTTPAVPTGLTATRSGANVTLSWANPANGDAGVQVLDSADGGAATEIARLAADATSHTHTAASSATSHRYTVKTWSLDPAGVLLYSASSTASVLIPGTPIASTAVVVSRTSDTSHTVTWTNNTNTHDAYDSQAVERTENGGTSWTVLSSALTAGATSYTDTTTVANRRYAYRVRAVNVTGSATSAASAYFSTTPAAPTTLVAVKNGTSIDLTWANPATGEAGVQILDSLSGAASVEVARLAADATSWNHVGPDGAQTHTYTARAWSLDPAGVLLYSATSTASNTVQLLAAPSAPSNLAVKVSGVTVTVLDAAADAVASWTHNPIDTTPQTAYEVETSTNGGTSWTSTGKIVVGTSSRTFAAGTFANGLASVLWRVRTWGSFSDPSEWSAPSTFATSAVPVAAITSPTPGQVILGNRLTLAWSYSDAEGAPQSGFRAVLKSAAGVTLETIEESTTGTSKTFSTTLTDAATYSATLQVRQGVQWSTAQTVSFSVDYAEPAHPTVTAAWDPNLATVVLSITNPTVEGLPAVVSNDVLRQIANGDWVTIAANVAPGSTLIDWTPSVGEPNTYRVDAVSALPSSSQSATVTVSADRASRLRFWISAGANFALVASFVGNPAVARELALEGALNHYAGRALPVPTDGEAVDRSWSLAGVLDDAWTLSQVDAFEAVLLAGKVALYRDGLGSRYFVKLRKISFDVTTPGAVKFSATFVQVGWSEIAYQPNPWYAETAPGVWRVMMPAVDGVGVLDVIP